MAFYIPIWLESRDGARLTYLYTQPIHAPDPAKPKRLKVVGENRGLVQYDLDTGEFAQLSGADWDEGQVIFARVCVALKKRLRNGEIPERTEYAA